jgi:dihydrodipicolinate synthase/N-acetylneuraminate lyase
VNHPGDVVPPVRPRRTIDGIAALLLPFDGSDRPDLDGLATLVRATADAGLTPAVNMDTGFGPELSPAQRSDVLRLTCDVLGPHARFVAGAMPFGHDETDPERAYRAEIAQIAERGGTPIIFPSPALATDDVAGCYERILKDCPAALAFELGTMFAPFGRIFDDDTVRRLLALPNLVGMKHSSLDRRTEWKRLALRDAERPNFGIYTGNDLAIDMVCYGSDYLLGLATFDPASFATRDTWWVEGDARFYPLNDALQAVGAVAFRDPVPAYKHTAATYLRITGRLADPHPHTSCPARPDWEEQLLRPLAARVDAARSL